MFHTFKTGEIFIGCWEPVPGSFNTLYINVWLPAEVSPLNNKKMNAHSHLVNMLMFSPLKESMKKSLDKSKLPVLEQPLVSGSSGLMCSRPSNKHDFKADHV